MEISFFLRCFLIGALGASGCGPLFVLTFNRSAVCGFWKGFATALGASFVDACYFFLGLLGALAILSKLYGVMICLDFVGGSVLFMLGIYAIKRMQQVSCVAVECSSSFIVAFGKAVSLALVNPLVVLFFMAVSVHALPREVHKLPLNTLLLSSCCVMLGSLTILSLVSLVASGVGACITARRNKIISGITGVLFLVFAVYLFVDGFLKLISLFR